MEIRFLGHAAFALTHEGTTVLIDPFLTGNPKAAASADEVDATTILVSHGHGDHVGDSVAIAKRTGAPVVAIVEIANEIGGEGVDVFDPNIGGTVTFDWGWVRLTPAWHTSTTPNGTVAMPTGLVVNIGGKTIYHLGDTALFSDLALARPARQPRRGADPDRRPLHDGPPRRGGGGEAGRRQAGDPLPLRHVPADRDRRRRPSRPTSRRRPSRRRSWSSSRGRRTRRDHALVLIQAERAAMATLGGALADVEGVAEAYSVTGEWDFVAIIRVREPEQLDALVTGQLAQLAGIVRTHTMVAFEVFSRHDLEALFSIGG